MGGRGGARPDSLPADELYSTTGYSVGARGMMFNRDRALLTLDTHDGKWRLPGGTVRPRETPADAVRRVIGKSLRLEIEVASFIGVTHCPRECSLEIIFEVRPANGSRVDPDTDEVLHAMWFYCHALPEDICASARSAIKACGGIQPEPFLVTLAEAEVCIWQP